MAGDTLQSAGLTLGETVVPGFRQLPIWIRALLAVLITEPIPSKGIDSDAGAVGHNGRRPKPERRRLTGSAWPEHRDVGVRHLGSLWRNLGADESWTSRRQPWSVLVSRDGLKRPALA